MDMITVLGTVAATASVASFAPQALKVIHSRKTQGLSAGMYVLTVFAFTCWTSFGILKQEWALIIPNAICGIISGFILLMILLPARKTAAVAKSLDPSE